MSSKRTNIEIDSRKLAKAKRISGCKTTREVVDYALGRLIQSAKNLKEILNLRGQIHFGPNYNYKASR